MSETVRSRFHKVMSGEMPEDHLPLLEWAGWWDQTITRWRGEGLPVELEIYDLKRHFGLDVNYQIWFPQFAPGAPAGPIPGSWVLDESHYEALLPWLYPDPAPFDRELWKRYAAEQERGEVICWISLSGFFWWPRTLFGIEPHLLAFYDQKDLMHRMNEDQLAYMHRCIEQFCDLCVPDFMTFGEDMSYNHGPMIGQTLFEEYLTPYYHRIIPALKERGIHILIDSDGQIEPLVPWFENCGLEGLLPLERMAEVDVNRVREQHPQWKMIGGFDKTVMHLGEARIRQEFERLMPAVKAGYFIPSCDHQTPPGVSLEDYKLYVRLLKEYMTEACR
ncbi:MAG: uroporphyrinogen decarboxylase family protein [Armatimonadota bacterium]